MTPSLVRRTKGVSGSGSAAAASRAAIFGPASAACSDQPAVSRTLTKLKSASGPAVSPNRGASWVQPTISGPAAAAARNFSSSARHSWLAVLTSAPRQPRRTAPASSGIVSSHEHKKIALGRSVVMALGQSRGRAGSRIVHLIVIMAAKHEAATAMPLDAETHMRRAVPGGLDLPPPFRAIALREVGDAFAHAVAVADKEGAGTLVHVGRFDLAEFAVVLEPDEPLRTARRTIYAGMAA